MREEETKTFAEKFMEHQAMRIKEMRQRQRDTPQLVKKHR